MKNFTIFILLSFLIFGSAFLPVNNDYNENAIQQATAQFHAGLVEFNFSIDYLAQLAKELEPTQASTAALQEAHIQNRLSFKKIEFFLEYFDRYSIKKMINGAPLLSVEPKVPEVNVIEPTGLQVLDELIFSEQPFENKEEILKQAIQLKNDYKKVKAYQQKIRITHRHIFEASRQELVRVFTLGLTGFDTPGSVNAIPEAITSLQSLSILLQPYCKMGYRKNSSLSIKIGDLFAASIDYLGEHNDFEQFDRMHFLKQYIDPLYAAIYNLQRILNVETIKETTAQTQSVNYEALSIFDNDFLNKSFYSKINFENPQTKKKIELGKLLFFDPILSSNNKRSCASCHQPEKAFTDGLKKSLALDGEGTIKRNAPTVINAVFSERYFYDLREPDLERQIKHVVMDHKEFDTDFFAIKKKLEKSSKYKALFEAAYPEYPKYTLSTYSISDALATYVTSLSSFNSPFDQFVRNEITSIDSDVIAGFNLFMGKAACGTCHFAPTFNGSVPPIYDESESEVLGVPASKDTLNPQLDTDLGRAASRRPIDETEFYKHSFKTVTVRNIAQTAPYMHNGVYDTLEEVIDFYNKGGGIGLGLEVPYQTLPDAPLNLTATEKDQLVSFMEALTDKTIDTSKPESLPTFENNPEWNNRTIGGVY